VRDFLIASCHFPSTLRVSGFGPVFAGCFFAALRMVWGGQERYNSVESVSKKEIPAKEGCSLRIRHDLVFISCVLFTVALACLIPIAWWNVQAGYGDMGKLEAAWRALARSYSDVGKLELALIFIGLIVTWTGYLNKVRWTWFVMFILVSGLVFQPSIFPVVMHPQWVAEAASEYILEAAGKRPVTTSWGMAWRAVFLPISIFSLMVLALFLPAKSFFSLRTGPAMGSSL